MQAPPFCPQLIEGQKGGACRVIKNQIKSAAKISGALPVKLASILWRVQVRMLLVKPRYSLFDDLLPRGLVIFSSSCQFSFLFLRLQKFSEGRELSTENLRCQFRRQRLP